MEKIKHFVLPEHTNTLYDHEAISSISLTKEVAAKINEIVEQLNSISQWNLEKHQEQDGIIRKGVLYMKDNLINSLNDLMDLLLENGFVDNRIKEHQKDLYNNIDLLTNRLDILLGKVVQGTTSMDAEIIDGRIDINGQVYESLGQAIREQLTMLPIGKRAIEQGDSLNLNHYTKAGNYVFTIYEGIINMPYGVISGADIPRYLKVECFGSKIPDLGNIQTWGKQWLYTENGEKVFKRYFKWNYSINDFTFEPWVHEGTNNHFRTITTGDMNKIIEPDNYIIATGELPNMPFSGRGGLLEVKNYSYGWLIQEVYGLPDFREHWYRIGNSLDQTKHTNEENNIKWSAWEHVATGSTIKNMLGSVDTTFTNKGYVVVNMGDSLFGNFRDETSISNLIALSTGANVYNFGFGGCRMGYHDSPWNYYGMSKLANSIVSGDYSTQESGLSHVDIPDYFTETINTMKTFDFSKVDILTINYGINDFTGSNAVDDSNNKYNTSTYGGGLRYSIEKLLAKYPNMRIVLISPCWSYWLTSGVYSYDSDTHMIGGRKLHEYVEKCESIAKEYHLPFVNVYDQLGVNKFNCANYSTDGIHPTEEGRKAIAKLVANTIKGM